VKVYDSETGAQLGKSIHPDAAGKPIHDQSLAEFSGSQIIASPDREAACNGEWLEDHSSPYDAELEIYVFDERTVLGQRYAKVRFCGQWAWVLVPENATMYDLAPVEISCYRQRQQEANRPPHNLPELVPLKQGVPQTIAEKFSVTRGNWEKRIRLTEPGILRASLPKDSAPHNFTIGLESSAGPIGEGLPGLSQTIEEGQPFEALVPAGIYRIQLQEGGEEGYEPPCPPNEQSLGLVVLPPPAALNLAGKAVSSDSEQALSLSGQRQRYDVLLTRLSPVITLSADLKSVAFVSIEELKRVERVYVRVRHGRSDMVQIPFDQQRLLAGPGKLSIEIRSEESDNWKPTDGVLISFFMSTVMGNPTDKLFEPTLAPGLSFPGSTVQFRNVSGLDLKDVELEFNYRQIENHYKGVQKVPIWKKGDVHNFRFPSEKNQPLGPESLRLTVKAINGTDEIDFSLENPQYPSMGAVTSWVPSAEYDEKIKFRVWEYCGTLDPGHGKGFQACQDRWIREEFACRRTDDPRIPAFITCVRNGIAKNFPELLPHLGH
jgi:hypothetical protein